MKKTLRGPALNEAVRDYVKTYILDHDLNGGDALPSEVQLAQDLGVGRSSVREAIKSLQTLGIVEVQHGNGLFVREYNLDPVFETLSYGMRFDTNTLAEFTAIRIWLEVAIIGDATKKISKDDISRLRAIMASWEERVTRGESDSDLDEQFHRILYESLNNQTLVKLLEVFWNAFKNLEIDIIRTSEPAAELKQHLAILEAVEAGNTDLVRERLIQHFTPLRQRIDQAIKSEAYISNDK